MNGERYRDPTADNAVRHADRTPEPVMKIIYMLRDIAGLAGFEIVGRICLRDKTTGREYR
jgi:hypothetical protein